MVESDNSERTRSQLAEKLQLTVWIADDGNVATVKFVAKNSDLDATTMEAYMTGVAKGGNCHRVIHPNPDRIVAEGEGERATVDKRLYSSLTFTLNFGEGVSVEHHR
jgi:hypothetical protein